jgi:hypothetical protein
LIVARNGLTANGPDAFPGTKVEADPAAIGVLLPFVLIGIGAINSFLVASPVAFLI